MAYELTPRHEAMRRAVRKLAEGVVAPRAAEIDATGEFPWDIKEALAKHDILRLPVPAEYGGLGADHLTVCLAVEEIARCCVTSSLILAVQELGSLPITLAGTEEQKRAYLPRVARGESLIAFGLTEPGAGSDVASLATRAVRRGDEYVLNGVKRFITHGGIADVYSVFATTDPAAGPRGVTAFVVQSDAPGFRCTRHEAKMGIRGSPTGELLFEDARVPVSKRLGAEGEGFKIAMQTLDRTRLGIGAQAVGVAQGALDYAVRYSREREAFGKPISGFQGVQFMLADMAMQVEAARALLYRAAAVADRESPDLAYYSAMAKCFCSDVAMRVTTDAVQVLGGYGYITEFPVERMMRDAKITQIYEGTNQIQRIIIGRALTGERAV